MLVPKSGHIIVPVLTNQRHCSSSLNWNWTKYLLDEFVWQVVECSWTREVFIKEMIENVIIIAIILQQPFNAVIVSIINSFESMIEWSIQCCHQPGRIYVASAWAHIKPLKPHLSTLADNVTCRYSMSKNISINTYNFLTHTSWSFLTSVQHRNPFTSSIRVTWNKSLIKGYQCWLNTTKIIKCEYVYLFSIRFRYFKFNKH